MTRILGAPTATIEKVEAAIKKQSPAPVFVDHIFPQVWYAALWYQVDPVGAVAQAAHETRWGKFGGTIDERWRNTCGLKIRDTRIVPEAATATSTDHLPLCHASFGSWTIGARAHIQHLVAYAGGFVDLYERVDPRYEWVDQTRPCVEFRDLNGRWSPKADYGDLVEAVVTRLTS